MLTKQTSITLWLGRCIATMVIMQVDRSPVASVFFKYLVNVMSYDISLTTSLFRPFHL